jgi:hypothetical protein
MRIRGLIGIGMKNVSATMPMLFGLYGDDGLLHLVGHSRVYDAAAEIAELLKPLLNGRGFTGRTPGGKRPVDGQNPEDGQA